MSRELIGRCAHFILDVLKFSLLLLMLHYAFCCFWVAGLGKAWSVHPLLGLFGILTLIGIGAVGYKFGPTVAKRLLERKSLRLSLPITSTLLLGFFAFLTNPELTSDFRSYWEIGEQLSRGFVGSSWVHVSRSLGYTAPVHLFLGGSLSALRVVNLALILGSALLLFKLCCRFADRKVGYLAATLFMLWPDILLAMPFTSHDIAAVWWLMVFFYLQTRLEDAIAARRLGLMFVTSLLFGINLAILEIQRTYGTLLLAALLTYLGVTALQAWTRDESFQWLRPLVYLVLPMVVYLGLTSYCRALYLQPGGEYYPISHWITTMDVEGSGDYVDITNWLMLVPEVEPAQQKEFMLEKILTEVCSRPVAFLTYLGNRNMQLARVDNYVLFYPDSGSTKFKVLGYLMSWFTACLVLGTAAWLHKSDYRKLSPEVTFLGVVPATLYFVLWLMGHIQGRYDIFLVVPLTLFTALWLLEEPFQPERPPRYFPGGLVLAMLLGLFFAFSALVRGEEKVFLDLREMKPVQEQNLQVNRSIYKRFQIGLSPVSDGSRGQFVAELPLELGQRRLTRVVFVLNPVFHLVLDRPEASNVPFKVSVSLEGTPLFEGEMSRADKPKYVRVSQADLPTELTDKPVLTFQVETDQVEQLRATLAENEPLIAIEYLDLKSE